MMLRRPTLLNTGGSGDLAGRSCDSWQLQETQSVTHVVPAQLSPAAQESWLAESELERSQTRLGRYSWSRGRSE